jgi:ribose transport system substrate-binding protein
MNFEKRRTAMKRSIKLTAIIMITLMLLVSAGCNGNTDKNTSGQGTEPKYTIGVSLPDVRGPFFTALAYGIVSQAQARGVEAILLDAGGYEFVDKQISQMEDFITRKVDGILLDPADDKAVSPMVDRAVESNIPVVGSGSPVDNPNVATCVSVDHTELGREMARYLVTAMNGKGKIIVLAGPSGALWTENRYDGFTEIIAQNPGMEIIATQLGAPDRATGLKLAEDLLGRYPDATGMYAADDSIGQGAGDALVAAGKTEQVQLVTAVIGPDTETMIRDGIIDASVAQKTVVIGQVSIDTIIDVIEGKQFQGDIIIPTVTVTTDNINSVNMDEIRQPAGWRP